MTNLEFAMMDLNTLKAEELKQLAKEHQVKNWWTMKKADLLATLSEIQAEAKEEEHCTEEDMEELIEKAKEEINQDSLIPMPGTEDPNWGNKAAGKKASKPQKNEDNLVTIKELASEFHMKGTKARRLLRNETAARPFGGNRWEWDKELHTKELERAREILKAHTK